VNELSVKRRGYKWILFAAAAALLGTVLLVANLPRPADQVPPAYDAGILLRPLSFIPPDSYRVTSLDFTRFPLIARVFQAYENPQCCGEARIETGGTLIFLVFESQALPVTEYLYQQFEALNPDPARPFTIVLAYENWYISWELAIS